MKGNMLLGQARGSVGDVVFTHYKGQQTAHARNRSPQNPKTIAQMMQRSLFVDAQKFFTRGVQNLFKFAFESKKEKESDFNVFMRYNINKGVNISPSAFNTASYPALGNWLLSQGSMPTPEVTVKPQGGGNLYALSCSEYSGQPSVSVGTVSGLLKSYYNLEDGDFVTFILIDAPGSTVNNTPTVSPDAREPITWSINQIKIDETDTRTISSLFYPVSILVNENYISFSDANETMISAGAVIFSRKQARGVKVSTSYLVNNSSALTAIDNSRKTEYINEVMEAWGANSDSILEGNVADATACGWQSFKGASTEDNASSLAATAVGATLSNGYTAGADNYVMGYCSNPLALDVTKFTLPDEITFVEGFIIKGSGLKLKISVAAGATGTLTVGYDGITLFKIDAA